MFSINGQIHQIEDNILEQMLCNASIIIYSVLCNHHTPGFLSCIWTLSMYKPLVEWSGGWSWGKWKLSSSHYLQSNHWLPQHNYLT